MKLLDKRLSFDKPERLAIVQWKGDGKVLPNRRYFVVGHVVAKSLKEGVFLAEKQVHRGTFQVMLEANLPSYLHGRSSP